MKVGSIVEAAWDLNGIFGMAHAEIIEIHDDFAVVQLRKHPDNWLGEGKILALPFNGAFDYSRNNGIFPLKANKNSSS